MTLTELITANPAWATWTDVQIAAEINRIDPSIQIERDFVPSHEVLEATAPAEWAALSTAERQRYQTITGAGEINVKGPNTRAAFAAMFGAGTQTRTNLIALQTRPGTLGEQNDLGILQVSDVAAARRDDLGNPLIEGHS